MFDSHKHNILYWRKLVLNKCLEYSLKLDKDEEEIYSNEFRDMAIKGCKEMTDEELTNVYLVLQHKLATALMFADIVNRELVRRGK